MNRDVCEKYNHYKPPYNYGSKFKCSCARDANLKPCPVQQVPDKCVYKCEQEQVCDHRCAKPDDHGLLQYRRWWERIEVDIAVNGDHITGTPIFIKDDTLRVVNDDFSYFIPLSKVDFIRTDDGLRSSFR